MNKSETKISTKHRNDPVLIYSPTSNLPNSEAPFIEKRKKIFEKGQFLPHFPQSD